MTTTTETAWPEGVIARYLTVGGAPVDVAERAGYYDNPDSTETASTCTGCGESETVEWKRNAWSYSENCYVEEMDEAGCLSTPRARDWAQKHAEKCRAMPRPA